jgi:hypothetical protein
MFKMNKKRDFYSLIGLFILIALSINNLDIISSEDNSEENKINLAYSCLNEKVNIKTCNALSIEEKIFVSLAIGKCEEEINNSSKNNECWPKTNCNIKNTAQSIIALNKNNIETEKAENWLVSKKLSPSEIVWYLQIESPKKTNCKIKYYGNEYPVIIGEDKKLNSGAGNCLTLNSDSYWLEIDNNCYDQTFEISCDESFLTNLLFKKQNSPIIYVLEDTHSSSPNGKTKESVNFSCFSTGSSCDYEGTLWASLALANVNKPIKEYLPYLISAKDENQQFIPESFLYILTGYSEFKNELLLKQKSNQYWDESGNDLYDTALALYPFPYSNLLEKTNSINWLLEIQGKNGCWRDSIRDTAFLLYSIWPTDFYFEEDPNNGEEEQSYCGDGICDSDENCSNCEIDCGNCEEESYCGDGICDSDENCSNCEIDCGNCEEEGENWWEEDEEGGWWEEETIDCVEAGYFCVPAIECKGNILLEYSCDGSYKCCDTKPEEEKCVEQGGEICNSNQECIGGTIIGAGDLEYGQICCYGGSCEEPVEYEESECEEYGGICRISCYDYENEGDYECDVINDVCCFKKQEKIEDKNDLWIWILIILIILVIIAIIFRNKLKPFWFRLTSKFKKSPPKKPGMNNNQLMPPPTNVFQGRNRPPRRILPPNSNPRQMRPPFNSPPRRNKEVDNVLKKLKEMGE